MRPAVAAGLELLARRSGVHGTSGDEPAGELVRLGDRAPDALDRVAEAALEAQGGAAVDGHLRAGHQGFSSRCCSRASRRCVPVAAVRLEPAGDLGQRLGAQPVPAALAVGPDRDEPGLAQHLEVLGDAGLAEVQVRDEVVHATARRRAAGRGSGGARARRRRRRRSSLIILPYGNMNVRGASSRRPRAYRRCAVPPPRSIAGQASTEYVALLAVVCAVVAGAAAVGSVPPLAAQVARARCGTGSAWSSGGVCTAARGARRRASRRASSSARTDRERLGGRLLVVRLGRGDALLVERRSDGSAAVSFADGGERRARRSASACSSRA